MHGILVWQAESISIVRSDRTKLEFKPLTVEELGRRGLGALKWISDTPVKSRRTFTCMQFANNDEDEITNTNMTHANERSLVSLRLSFLKYCHLRFDLSRASARKNLRRGFSSLYERNTWKLRFEDLRIAVILIVKITVLLRRTTHRCRYPQSIKCTSTK